MSKAIILDSNYEKIGEMDLPQMYKEINSHNYYLYIKSYLSETRSNTARAKKRGEVSGGGRKPWSQKGGGRARAGSITSPVFVGGGVSHGPLNNRNYELKINKKQKKLAFRFALNEKALLSKLYIIDNLSFDSGKTKDVASVVKKIDDRGCLFMVTEANEKSALAVRNIKNSDFLSKNTLNAYVLSCFSSVIMERKLFENIINEG